MQPSSSTVLLGLATVFSAQLHLSAQQLYSVNLAGRTGDSITLACRDESQNNINLAEATGVGFYVNISMGDRTGSPNIEDILGRSAVTRGSAGATFRITRDAEGYYSCAPNNASTMSHLPPRAKLLTGEPLASIHFLVNIIYIV